MDASTYKVDKPYPTKAQFTTTYWYALGKLVASSIGNGPICELDSEGRVVRHLDASDVKNLVREAVTDDTAFKAARDAYGREESLVYERFKHDLFEELGIQHHPLREKLFSKAWEDGHSAGYGEVLTCAHDLMDLIELPKGAVLVSKDCVYWGGLGCPSIEADGAAATLQEKLA